MIILEGPDNAGKTTLAQQLLIRSAGANEHSTYKAVAMTSYKDYMGILRGPKSNPLDISTYRPGLALASEGKIVCDRLFYSELPYARLFRKVQRTQFTLKQWHNMHLSTIAFNPVVVLATRKAHDYQDSVPEELFNPILKEYKYWFKLHGISYYEYDFEDADSDSPEEILETERYYLEVSRWWITMARQGLAGVGNTTNPKVVIMAQDLGPSNIHRIPFEQGPSGYYLSDLIDEAEIPLNSFYLTNWLKTKDMGENVGYLRTEMEHLSRDSRGGLRVILLGREAEQSAPILRDYVVPEAIHTVRHPGWVVNHSYTMKEKFQREEKYLADWKELWKMILGTPDSSLRTLPGAVRV